MIRKSLDRCHEAGANRLARWTATAEHVGGCLRRQICVRLRKCLCLQLGSRYRMVMVMLLG